MEIFDLVSENDETTGIASREDCHQNPKLIHHTVHFTLLDKNTNKILLTTRALTKKTDPGKLCFLGEHIQKGESYTDGLKRGVLEELGFSPKSFFETGHRLFHFPHETEFVRFFIVIWNGETIKYDQHEIATIQWLDLKTLIRKSPTYSDITKHWTDHTDWKKYFA